MLVTMAVKTATVDPLIPNGYKISASILLVLDALLISLIIAYVPYTKIDWDAYMSQVSGFLQGERDYRNLKGDTGPLVYPAGFLYVYSAIQFVTGGKVYPAQILFGILYIINLGIILFIYIKTNVVHRLDRESSCLLLMGRTKESIARLHWLFSEMNKAKSSCQESKCNLRLCR